jgi:preprotein translocase subunit YajC
VRDAAVTLAWIGGLILLTWVLFIRPRRSAVARQRQVLAALSSGDQVVTVGGIYGTIVAIDGDEVRLEVAPDVVVRVARRAVAARVGIPPPADGAESGDAH